MFTEVAPNVFSVEHPHVEGKNGIVIGRRAALAIDSGSHLSEGQAMVDIIRARDAFLGYLVFTHGHNDHVLGSAAFKDVEVIAHVLTPAVMEQMGSGWAKRSNTSTEQLRKQLAWPTITFTGELNIELGGKHLRLFPTPGHSDDSICVYVEEDCVLFAGDTVFSGIPPAIGSGNGAQLESTLRGLAGMEIKVLVPGHGRLRCDKESVREWLNWEIDYLARIRAFVRYELAQGQSPKSIATRATFDEFIGNRIPKDKHGTPNRHGSVVSKIIQEELER